MFKRETLQLLCVLVWIQLTVVIADDPYHPPLLVPKVAPSAAEKQDWIKIAQDDLKEKLRPIINTNVAKNVILFVGDGYGITTMTASRILKGQRKGKTGEEEQLAFEKFPYTGLSKTYNVDAQVGDSAATATAYLCGVKTNFYTVGVNENVLNEPCGSVKGNEVDSILKWSQAEGKSVGFVTTTEITHATPSTTYAHTSSRHAQYEVPANSTDCEDIGSQFLKYAKDFQVALAGGRSHLTPTSRTDEGKNNTGLRSDGRNIIQEWQDHHQTSGNRYKYVWKKDDLNNVKAPETDHVLGLFAPEHMNFIDERLPEEPSLVDMTRKALEILEKNPKGYFLLVEGGRIDHGSHEGRAARALNEALEFDDAVSVAMTMTSEQNTLIVVTADHSHTLMLSGYSQRGNPILGLATERIGSDDMPYTSLLYGNGPGFSRTHETIRRNVTNDKTDEPTYRQESAVPMKKELHGGEDVAIFARGPMSHLFGGVHEQHYIAHAMGYASCVGMNKEHCASYNNMGSNVGSFRRSHNIIHVTLLLVLNYWFQMR